MTFKPKLGVNQTKLTGPGKDSLCKFFLTQNCHRGADCNFSHSTKDFACKYLHGTGKCDKSNSCIFKHEVMSTTEEIMKFISDNEDFLMKLYSDTGRTNLGEYFLNYLREK